jgi:hypothetical protein
MRGQVQDRTRIRWNGGVLMSVGTPALRHIRNVQVLQSGIAGVRALRCGTIKLGLLVVARGLFISKNPSDRHGDTDTVDGAKVLSEECNGDDGDADTFEGIGNGVRHWRDECQRVEGELRGEEVDKTCGEQDSRDVPGRRCKREVARAGS